MTDIDLTHAFVGHDSDEQAAQVDEDIRRMLVYLELFDYNATITQEAIFRLNTSPIIFALRDIRRKGKRID